ncbi:thioesterase family protein [Sneathiella limimaris]|uniref:thioesterase family protein n=1 Tax=Sneathiella limimaris TaxID=1964213 RepID=UPI00146D8F07|nr:thioesterase family protein [Sneathiella limimaris]
MIENNKNILRQLTVLPEWIDHNQHMNVAYYVLIFDQSLDVLLDNIELTRDYRAQSGNTVYVLETHVCYLQEVKEGDPLDITCRVIDCDEKRIHLYLEMYHGKDGFLAATSEQMILHIDAAGPKATPMPAFIQNNLETLKQEQAHLPMPEKLGSKIGIRRKTA